VLWTPPLIDEWKRAPGNLSILADFFGHPPSPPIGLERAAELVLQHLDASYLLSHARAGLLETVAEMSAPQAKRGAICLVIWLAGALIGMKLGSRSLRALHGLVEVCILVSVIAISRIVGPPWPYLMLGTWGIGALLLLSTVATPFMFAGQKGMLGSEARRLGALLGIALIAGDAARLVKRADQAGSMVPTYAAQLAVLVRGTADALERGVGAASGREGRYLVTWADVGTGVQGYGMVNELERQGFRVGVLAEHAAALGAHRVLDPELATARVHVATGAFMRDALHIPGAEAAVYSDVLSVEQRQEYDALKEAVARALRQLGRADAAERFDRDISAAAVPGLPPVHSMALLRMGELGPQAGVFIAPLK